MTQRRAARKRGATQVSVVSPKQMERLQGQDNQLIGCWLVQCEHSRGRLCVCSPDSPPQMADMTDEKVSQKGRAQSRAGVTSSWRVTGAQVLQLREGKRTGGCGRPLVESCGGRTGGWLLFPQRTRKLCQLGEWEEGGVLEAEKVWQGHPSGSVWPWAELTDPDRRSICSVMLLACSVVFIFFLFLPCFLDSLKCVCISLVI